MLHNSDNPIIARVINILLSKKIIFFLLPFGYINSVDARCLIKIPRPDAGQINCDVCSLQKCTDIQDVQQTKTP